MSNVGKLSRLFFFIFVFYIYFDIYFDVCESGLFDIGSMSRM